MRFSPRRLSRRLSRRHYGASGSFVRPHESVLNASSSSERRQYLDQGCRAYSCLRPTRTYIHCTGNILSVVRQRPSEHASRSGSDHQCRLGSKRLSHFGLGQSVCFVNLDSSLRNRKVSTCRLPLSDVTPSLIAGFKLDHEILGTFDVVGLTELCDRLFRF